MNAFQHDLSHTVTFLAACAAVNYERQLRDLVPFFLAACAAVNFWRKWAMNRGNFLAACAAVNTSASLKVALFFFLAACAAVNRAYLITTLSLLKNFHAFRRKTLFINLHRQAFKIKAWR